MTDNQKKTSEKSDDDSKVALRAIKRENYMKNIESFYNQDSSDFRAIRNNNKTKDDLDKKYKSYTRRSNV
ncbi:hypothetical protein CS022_22550 [Veronia nyctiphanis]|uniref:Uncharacterized protein n=1 Tax=Veronia nyctiphanis TaxID=1278244 RepID=A0A4Q0YIX2_9GAMM|nr:hypothetical protein [Veronia nyctiphanis]RXJ70650.1 hypothetical protein CS022_22550 [Veronia nyctiphanis]